MRKEFEMASFLEELADKAGLRSDQAHQGVGALLTMLKDRLDPETFSRLQQSIPNAAEVLAKCQSKAQEAKGNLLDALKEISGKLLGGSNQDAIAAVQSHFANFGLSADHLKSLLPALGETLAKRLPPDLMNQIHMHVPGLDRSTEETVAQSGST
jgi:uncharacterized protein (DUF2267 family)